jgi:predicted protein tyrosine phosphatase
MKKVLFICSRNRLRSPTAEQLYSETPNLEVVSAGLNNEAEVTVTPELLDWAELIFVMEQKHRNKLSRTFPDSLRNKRVVSLDIPDDYDFMDPALILLLKQKLTPFLGPPLKENAQLTSGGQTETGASQKQR